jgi:hypothetical protein
MMQFREASNKISWTTRLINFVSNFDLFSLQELSTACRENQSLDTYLLRHQQFDPFAKDSSWIQVSIVASTNSSKAFFSKASRNGFQSM